MLDMTPTGSILPQETVPPLTPDTKRPSPAAYVVAVVGGVGLGLLVGFLSALSLGLIMLC